MDETKRCADICAEIKLADAAIENAFENLRLVQQDAQCGHNRDAAYFNKVYVALNVCSYVCRVRAKLEFELDEAERAGR